ncbi:MAG: carotenoid oxygenase family protein [Pseudomonadota bacterium]
MYKRFILDFIPWIFFPMISHWIGPTYAASLMIIWVAIISRQSLKKGFLLDWGALVFFIIILLSTLPDVNLPRLYSHPSLWSNIGLATIMWISLIVNKPFTLQYAKEKAPQEVHKMRIFRRINYSMTLIWSLLITVMALLSWAQVMLDWKGEISSIMSIVIIVCGIRLNLRLPNWFVGFAYRRRLKKISPVQSPFLQGNFAPVQKEIYQENLDFTGNIPEDLNGIYMRNGPNPAFHPILYRFPFDGDGMVHAVYFNKSNVAYRNKFIETKALQNERVIGKALYPGVGLPISPDPKLLKHYPDERRRNGAFIKVVQHAGKLLATLEASAESYEITKNLETVGVWQSNKKPQIKINAHARIDPETGELIAVNYDLSNQMNIVIINKYGNIKNQYNIEKSFSSIIHDFVITKNYIVVFDCPAIFNLEALYDEKFAKMIAWRPELSSQLMLISRRTGMVVKQYTVPAFWVYHFANGYEHKDEIIIDYMRAKRFCLDDQNYYAHLDRYVLNLSKSSAERQKLAEYNSDFPRINENYTTKPHQYIYSLAFDGLISHKLLKYDVVNQQISIRDFGSDAEIDEPQFIAKSNPAAEDDGYLLMFVYYRKSNTSTLVILDAQDISARVIAEIYLPQRVPHGLHGNWIV